LPPSKPKRPERRWTSALAQWYFPRTSDATMPEFLPTCQCEHRKQSRARTITDLPIIKQKSSEYFTCKWLATELFGSLARDHSGNKSGADANAKLTCESEFLHL